MKERALTHIFAATIFSTPKAAAHLRHFTRQVDFDKSKSSHLFDACFKLSPGMPPPMPYARRPLAAVTPRRQDHAGLPGNAHADEQDMAVETTISPPLTFICRHFSGPVLRGIRQPIR